MGNLRGYVRVGGKLRGGCTPLRYRKISKSYTIVKTLNPQKILNFETMKNFLKGGGLGKFLKSTTLSTYIYGKLVGSM